MKEVKTPKKPILYYIFLSCMALMLLNALFFPRVLTTQVSEVEYSDFLTMLDEGKIDTVEIEDEDNENVEEEETCYIKSDYAFGINPLNGGSAKQTALCIFHAIKEASTLGFKKIVFP